MRIVHISDFHYPIKKSQTESLIKSIIEHYHNTDLKPVVVMTGDVLQTTYTKDINYEKTKILLKKLVDKGFKLLICWGNHDIKKNGIKKRSYMKFYMKKFDSFYSDLLPLDNLTQGTEVSFFNSPLVFNINNHFFIGLDSLGGGSSYPRVARGKIGSEQRSKLKQHIINIRENHSDAKIICYLHHNPLSYDLNTEIHNWGTRLSDRIKLMEMLRGIDVLLFGHIHWNDRYVRDEKKYNIGCITLSGGSTHGNHVDWTEIDTSSNLSKIISY